MNEVEEALRRMVVLRESPFCEHDEYLEAVADYRALRCRKCSASVVVHPSIPWPEGLHLPPWPVEDRS